MRSRKGDWHFMTAKEATDYLRERCEELYSPKGIRKT